MNFVSACQHPLSCPQFIEFRLFSRFFIYTFLTVSLSLCYSLFVTIASAAFMASYFDPGLYCLVEFVVGHVTVY